MKTSNPVMEDLLQKAGDIKLPDPGSLVEGTVIAVHKNKILVDINGISTGVVSGREAKDSDDTIKKVQVGDKILAYVIEGENDEGYIVLSLRKASQERTWKRFMEAYETGEVITVRANEANKGGLLLEIDSIKGFIPVSQLAPMHYPRVNDADAHQILERLQKLIGEKFAVKIINIDKENGKLILSEKAAMEEQRRKALQTLQVGQKMSGVISGIVKFGIFVAFDGLEGLVHISEIAWGHVKDPSDHGKVGDKVEVMVIGVDGEKISLSMKRLTPDPWVEAAKQYKIGTVVEGEINRITPFGAFVKLNDDINGLIHVSELSSDTVKDPGTVLKVGQIVQAKVIALDPEEHRVGLSIKELTEPTEKKVKKKTSKADEESQEQEETSYESDEKDTEEAKSKKKGVMKKTKKS